MFDGLSLQTINMAFLSILFFLSPPPLSSLPIVVGGRLKRQLTIVNDKTIIGIPNSVQRRHHILNYSNLNNLPVVQSHSIYIFFLYDEFCRFIRVNVSFLVRLFRFLFQSVHYFVVLRLSIELVKLRDQYVCVSVCVRECINMFGHRCFCLLYEVFYRNDECFILNFQRY